MSLPNPDSVVTEQRLSEFYTGIRPYLGGMPDIYSNAFSKCNIYSEDEKLIGVWVNGKPIYQKVMTDLSIAMAWDGAYNTKGTAVSPIELTDLDDVIQVFGLLDNPRDQISLSYAKSVNKLIGTYSGTIKTLVWQYTKTADSAVAIGSDTDYSTTEKIVGTWIDNSPLYQKTVPTNESVPSGATLILRTAMASTGYDTILYTKA